MVSARWAASIDDISVSLLPLSTPSERMITALRPFNLLINSSEERNSAS